MAIWLNLCTSLASTLQSKVQLSTLQSNVQLSTRQYLANSEQVKVLPIKYSNAKVAVKYTHVKD